MGRQAGPHQNDDTGTMTADATRTTSPTSGIGVPTRVQHLRSGLFAFFFTPIALGMLGLAVTDSQSVAAVGQPLSSSVSMAGLLISTVLLGLIAVNADESPTGMVVMTAWSLVIGVLQLLGHTPVPAELFSSVSGSDTRASMLWCLYPVAVFAICLGATLATVEVRRRAVTALNQVDAGNPAAGTEAEGAPAPRDADARLEVVADVYAPGPAHYRERVFVTVSSVILACVAVTALVWAAPSDTLPVAAHGLAGLVPAHPFGTLAGLVAAVCLGVVAWGTRWSLFGAEVVAVFLMVVPAYLVLPVWSTLSGRVATPGASVLTSLSMAAPVVTALGLTLAALGLGAHWTRRRLREDIAHALRAHPAD